MTTTRALSLVAAGTLVLSLAACGGDGDGTDGATDSAGAGGAGESTTISWWHNSNTGAGLEYYTELAAQFEEETGVTVEMEAMAMRDYIATA